MSMGVHGRGDVLARAIWDGHHASRWAERKGTVSAASLLIGRHLLLLPVVQYLEHDGQKEYGG